MTEEMNMFGLRAEGKHEKYAKSNENENDNVHQNRMSWNKNNDIIMPLLSNAKMQNDK